MSYNETISDSVKRNVINAKGFLHRKLKTKQFHPMKDFLAIRQLFHEKTGIEIGGPSKIFSEKGFLPIYPSAKQVDGINFSDSTIWTGDITSENGYSFNNTKLGEQFIMDGSDLSSIKQQSYDFLLSSNNLEHIANPLKAIEQWLSVLKQSGTLVIITPRKESNFDHKRTTVTFNHLLSDYNNNVSEKDLTHLEEILQFHDLKMDKAAGTHEQFRERSLKNFENRCLHQHVFDIQVLKEIYGFFNISVVKTIELYSNYIIIGQK